MVPSGIFVLHLCSIWLISSMLLFLGTAKGAAVHHAAPACNRPPQPGVGKRKTPQKNPPKPNKNQPVRFNFCRTTCYRITYCRLLALLHIERQDESGIMNRDVDSF
jgi:hypothetical protein